MRVVMAIIQTHTIPIPNPIPITTIPMQTQIRAAITAPMETTIPTVTKVPIRVITILLLLLTTTPIATPTVIHMIITVQAMVIIGQDPIQTQKTVRIITTKSRTTVSKLATAMIKHAKSLQKLDSQQLPVCSLLLMQVRNRM